MNDAPVLSSFGRTVDEDAVLAFGVADFAAAFNDVDTEDSLQTVHITVLPSNGTLYLATTPVAVGQELTIEDLGNLSYYPVANYFGDDTIAWNASDGSAYAAADASISITVISQPDAPTLADSSKEVPEGGVLVFTSADFLSNFSDADGESLQTLRIGTLPDQGTLYLGTTPVVAGQDIPAAQLGELSYERPVDYSGETAFTWNASDGTFYAAADATVTLVLNRDPVGEDDTAAVDENSSLIVDVLANDHDANSGDVLVVDSVDATSTLGAAITIESDGSLRYDPTGVAALQALRDGETLVDEFQYTLADGHYATDTAVVTVTVSGISDPPTSSGIADVTWAHGDPVSTVPLRDSFDDEEDGASGLAYIVMQVSDPSLFSSVSIDALTGQLTLTYISDAIGSSTIRIRAIDTDDMFVESTFTATAVGNQVSGFAMTVSEDSTLALTATDFEANFSARTSGDSLQRVRITGLPSNGTLFLEETPVTLNQEIATADLANLTYVPTADYNGPDSFRWNGSYDDVYAENDAAVTITISSVNDAPQFAAGASQTVDEDAGPQAVTAWATGISAGPSNESGQRLSFEVVENDRPDLFADGPAIDATTGDLTYTPAANVFGTATIVVQLRDDGGTLRDGVSVSTFETFTITTNPILDPPEVFDFSKPSLGATIAFTANDFVENFSDTDGETLQTVKFLTAPEHGTLYVSGIAVVLEQDIATADLDNLTYEPDAGYTGSDSFVWSGSDGTSYAVANATVTLNTVPVVVGFAKDVREEESLAFTGTDFADCFIDTSGDGLLEVEVTILPTQGRLLLAGLAVTEGQKIAVADLNNLAFLPEANQTGAVTFCWKGSDGSDYSPADAQVQINIAPVNDPPFLEDIAKTLSEDVACAPLADFNAAYVDADGEAIVLAQITALPQHGTLYLSGVAVTRYQEIEMFELPNLIYQPDADYSGPDSFRWNASDGVEYALADATVLLTILPVNDAPQVSSFAKDMPQTGALTFLASDFTDHYSDVEAETLANVKITALPANGDLLLGGSLVAADQTIAFAELSTLTYEPNAGYEGYDSFAWTASDGNTFAAQGAIVSIGNPLVARDFSLAVLEDATLSFTTAYFADHFSDADGGSLQTVKISSLPVNGTLKLSGVDVSIDDEISVADLPNLSYVPDPDYNGADGFCWNGSNGTAYALVAAQVSIAVQQVNDAPDFTPGSDQTVLEDCGTTVVPGWATLVSRGPANESEQQLRFEIVNNDAPELFAVAPTIDPATGDLTYTPAADAFGTATITLLLRDNAGTASGGSNASSPYTFTVTITGTQDAPLVGDVSKTGLEDTDIVFTAADFEDQFTDIDGDTLQTIKITSLPTNGTLKLSGVAVSVDGEIAVADLANLTYVPNADYNGSDSFGWTGADAIEYAAVVGTVSLTISAVNDAPTFTVGTDQTVSEDSGVQTVAGWATNMSAGPTDESAQTLSFEVVGNDSPELFAVAPTIDPATGDLTYTPAADAFGTAQITLALKDDGGTANGGADTSAAQTFTIQITNTQDAPLVGDVSKTGLEDTAIVFTAADFEDQFTDIDGDTLQTIKITSLPTNGTLKLSGVAVGVDGEIAVADLANLTYVPNADYNGSDSFGWTGADAIEYAAVGGTVSLTISAVNDAPTFTVGSDQTVSEDSGVQTVVGWATNMSAGPTDESAQTLSFEVVGNDSPELFAVAPTIDPATGDLTYTPAADAFGTAQITLALKDDGGTANGGADTSAVQTFTIQITNTQDAPLVGNVSKTGLEDTDIVFTAADFEDQFTDIDGDTLQTIKITSLPTNGTLKLSGVAVSVDDEIAVADLANLTYVPNADYNGSDSFGWTGADAIEYAAVGGTVSLTISAVNDAPTFTVGTDQTVSEDSGVQTVAGWATNMSAGPTDEGAQILSFEVVGNDSPELFAVAPTIDAATGDLTYTPAADAFGTAQITLALKDDGGTANGGVDTSAQQTFTIEITNTQDPPVAGDDVFTTDEDTPLLITAAQLLANDSDPDNDLSLSVVATTTPAHGTLVDNGDDTWTYTPPLNFTGTDAFDYTLSDGNGGTDTGTVTINVFNLPDVAISGPAAVNEGTIYTLTLDYDTFAATGWTIDWGDGTIEDITGAPTSVDHTYDDGYQVRTIQATATDGVSTLTAPSLEIAVLNVAPTLELSGPELIQQGTVYTLTLTPTDPGDDTISQWDIDWGDGSETDTVYSPDLSMTHTYPTGEATYVITATATDEDGTYVAGNLIGQAGQRDTTFGSNGWAGASSLDGSKSTSAVAVQPDDKIVVAGSVNFSYSDDEFMLVRYNAVGTLDTTFGNGGLVSTDFYGYDDRAYDLIVQSDYSILVAGRASNGSNNDFAVARYLENGVLDTTFGTDGWVTHDLGGAEYARAMAVQSSGKILLLDSNGILIRCNPNGTRDTTFGTSGIVNIGLDSLRDVVVQSDDKIVVLGKSNNGSDEDFALARYDADGNLDTDFGSGGSVTVDLGGTDEAGREIALQSDGRILVVGTHTDDDGKDGMALARLLSNGDLDSTFTVGTETYDSTPGSPSLVVQSDGKIVVAVAYVMDQDFEYHGFQLLRYTDDGSLDEGFGTDGKLLSTFGPNPIAADVAVDSEDRIIVAGGYDTCIAVVRYTNGTYGLSVTVTEDEVVEVWVADTVDASESGEDGYFRLQRSGSTDDALTVYYSVVTAAPNRDATNGVDCLDIGNAVTFPAGQDTVDIPVDIIDDDELEGDEYLKIELDEDVDAYGGLYTIGSPSNGTVTIHDDEPFEIAIEKIQDATEDGQNGIFRLTRTGPTDNSLTVLYSVAPTSTASNGIDYFYLPGTSSASNIGSVTFAAGSTTVDITVVASDDSFLESDETLTVTIVNSTGGNTPYEAGTSASAAMTVFDNDTLPTVLVSSSEDAEEPGTPGYFRLTRSGQTSGALKVHYLIRPYYTTAVNGDDMELLPGTTSADDYYGYVTFAAGQTEVDIPVVPIDDYILEADKTITIQLLDKDYSEEGGESEVAALYQLGTPDTASLTLYDDDSSATPVVLASAYQGTEEGGDPGYIRLRRSGSLAAELVVPYTIDAVSSTALNGEDFYYLSGTSSANPTQGFVTFGAGSAYVDISVVAIDDELAEGAETIWITLSDPTGGYELGMPSTIVFTVGDNDELPTVTLGESVNETQTIVLPAAKGGSWTISNATSTSDPIPQNAECLQVQAAIESLDGISTGDVAVTGKGTLESPFIITYTGLLAATDIAQLSVDGSSLTGVSMAAATVTTDTEGVDGQNARYEIVLEASSSLSSGTFRFLWGDPAPCDYPQSEVPRKSDPIAWNADISTIKAAIEAIPNVADAGGTVHVTELESTSTRRRLQVEFTGTLGNKEISELFAVQDDDDPVTDSSGAMAGVGATALVSGSKGPVDEVQTLSITGAQSGTFTISFRSEETEPLQLDAEAADIQTALEGLSTIGYGNVEVSGDAGGPWQIAFTGDLAGANLELLTVDATGLSGGEILVATTADGGIGVNAASDAVEGAVAALFRIYRTGATDADLTVLYRVNGTGTATPGTDYDQLSGSVTIAAGETSAEIAVFALEDSTVETGETVSITLLESCDLDGEPLYTIGETADATIAISDFIPPETVSISVVQNADEAGTNGTFRITRSATTDAITVQLRVDYVDSAVETGDYQKLPNSVTFAAGQASVDIPVVVIDDAIVEGEETLQVTLTEVDHAGYVVGLAATAAMTIRDNDVQERPIVTVFEIAAAAEGGDAGYVRLVRDFDTASALTVSYRISATYSTAVNGEDMQYLPGTQSDNLLQGTVTFLAGEEYVDIAIAPIDDSEVEGTEALSLSLINDGSGNYDVGSPDGASVNILDNDFNDFPYVSQIRLVNDTGWSDTDQTTYDPQVEGSVEGNFQGGYVHLEFDHDGDFEPEGHEVVSATGTAFTYDPAATDPSLVDYKGTVVLRYRVVSYAADDSLLRTGDWNVFAFTLEDSPASGPVRVQDVDLLNDTGLDDDMLTVDPTLTGTVLGDFADGSVRIEFDHYGDDEVNGFVDVAVAGDQFSYDPRENDATVEAVEGDFLVRYRLIHLDSDGEPVTIGDWVDFEMVLHEVPESKFVVQGLRVQRDSGEVGTRRSVLAGYVSAGWGYSSTVSSGDQTYSALSGLPVEFSHQEGGAIDGKATTDENGQFSYTPAGLDYGEHTIRVRALEWSTEYGVYLKGAWTTFTFTWEQPVAPAIYWLATASGSYTTSNPALKGSISSSASDRSNVTVEFHLDTNDDPIGATWTDSEGQFTYTPTGINQGTVRIWARTKQWDALLQDSIYGAWKSLVFNYQPLVPTVTNLALLTDTSTTEESATSVATIVGQLTGNTDLYDVELQFSHDANLNTIEGYASSEYDGRFTYDPVGLPDSSVTISARAVVWDDAIGGYAFGQWASLAFEHKTTVNQAAEVEQLSLVNAISTDPLSATDPTLTGYISNDGSLSYLTVEFDYDDDHTEIVGTAQTDEYGSFVYLPTGLEGEVTVWASVVEWDYARQENVRGAWKDITFTMVVDANQAPMLEDLSLLSDSGTPADFHTANPALIGRVTDDRGSANLTVELDLNNDGFADAVTMTDAEGVFRYQPVGLPYGELTIKARVREWDASQEVYLESGWETLTFTYEQQPNAAPVLTEIGLPDPEAPQTVVSSRGPTVVGKITNEGSVENIAVEFDFDNDGVADQTALTDQDGTFSVTLAGLDSGDIAIRVQTRELDEVNHQYLCSGWQNLNFHYDAPVFTASEVTSLNLVNETGGDPENPVASDPTLTGTISLGSADGYVVVEFSHDSGDVVDGQTVCNADGTFNYVPDGLEPGAITIKARTKNYDNDGLIVRSDWFTFSFVLEESSVTGAYVSQLTLAYDTGASSTDGATANSTLRGRVLGAEPAATVTVQFDVDGDGIVDASKTPSTSGYFIYSPQGLAQGWNTVYARVLTDNAGITSTSSWTSLGFVLSNDPDGEEAQDILAAANQFSGDWANATDTYDAAVRNAALQYTTDAADAESQYEDTVQTATGDRTQALNDAQDQYNDDVAVADAAYVAAIEAANAAFQANLAAFAGDKASYEFNGFSWPDTVPDIDLTIPDDSTLPTPPAGAPTYTGPEYNWGADPIYKAAVATAKATHDATVRAAKWTLESAKKAAKSIYDDAVKAAQEGYDQKIKDAEEVYKNKIEETHPTIDLSVETRAHWDRVQAAREDYESTVKDHRESYNNFAEAATEALQAKIEAAHEEYSNCVTPAWEDYSDVCNAGNSTWQTRRSAYINYRRIEYNAAKTRDAAISDARRSYDETVGPAARDLNRALADARWDCDQAILDSEKTLDGKIAEHTLWVQENKIAAKIALDEAKIQAARERAEEIADAELQRANAVTAAERVQSETLATAQVGLWQAEVSAKQQAIVTWHANTQTRWTAYQLTLINNEVQYISDLSVAYLTRENAMLAPNQAQGEAEAAAACTLAYSLAEADWTRANDLLGAKEAYWQDLALARKTHSDTNAQSRWDLRDDQSEALNVRAKSYADAAYESADSRSEARHNLRPGPNLRAALCCGRGRSQQRQLLLLLGLVVVVGMLPHDRRSQGLDQQRRHSQ